MNERMIPIGLAVFLAAAGASASASTSYAGTNTYNVGCHQLSAAYPNLVFYPNTINYKFENTSMPSFYPFSTIIFSTTHSRCTRLLVRGRSPVPVLRLYARMRGGRCRRFSRPNGDQNSIRRAERRPHAGDRRRIHRPRRANRHDQS